MKLFRRLAINIHSGVETLADRFENKQALSTTFIREYERVVAKAKVRLTEVGREAEGLETEVKRLTEQIRIWTERARHINETDESKALECVARIKKNQAARQETQATLDETKALKRKMARDIEAALKKLGLLRRKHQNLAGRQVCAQAAQSLHHADHRVNDDIDDLFSRWEVEVVSGELRGRSSEIVTDPLAEAFETEEQQQELRDALEEIVSPKSSTKEG